jgi:hypothetical protein
LLLFGSREGRYDFLNLFEKTARLLDVDPSLICVSSWNDNSRNTLGVDPQLLMRTSYFPGLGWMLKVLIALVDVMYLLTNVSCTRRKARIWITYKQRGLR